MIKVMLSHNFAPSLTLDDDLWIITTCITALRTVYAWTHCDFLAILPFALVRLVNEYGGGGGGGGGEGEGGDKAGH